MWLQISGKIIVDPVTSFIYMYLRINFDLIEIVSEKLNYWLIVVIRPQLKLVANNFAKHAYGLWKLKLE